MITYSGREDTPLYVKAIAVGVVSAVCVAIAYGSYMRWTRFMDACMEDHPRYQCEVLWSQANPPTSTVNVYNRD